MNALPATGANPWFGRAFLLLLLGFVIYHGSRHYRHSGEHATQLTQLTEDFSTSDFEAWWRTSLRMHAADDVPGARPVYFPMGSREENPGKAPPAFYSALQALTPFGPRWGAVLFWLLSVASLLGTFSVGLALVRRASADIAEPMGRPGYSDWSVRLSFLLLIPYVHLCARYNQVGFMQVFLLLLALRWLPEKPTRAGLAIAAGCVIKPIALVMLPLLIWKKAYKATAGVLLGVAVSFLVVILDVGFDRSIALHVGWFEALADDPSMGGYHERYQGLPSFVLGSITPVYEDQIGEVADVSEWDGVRNFAASQQLWSHASWLIMITLGLLGLGCALGVRRSKSPDTPRRWLLETGFVLAAMLLMNPTTWKHYYWFLLPALLAAFVELRDPRSRRWAQAFLICVALLLTLPHRVLPRFIWEPYHVFHGIALGCLVLWLMMLSRLRQSRRD
ncbi:MAG: hypothetical protein ACJAYX_003916 [Planctomycetota bacterium]|jgi:hypothetical protein